MLSKLLSDLFSFVVFSFVFVLFFGGTKFSAKTTSGENSLPATTLNIKKKRN